MGKRMSWLNIRAQFPPIRKWMEVLPVHNQHPSCLRPLSRGEGMGFIWILDNCYCFTEAGRLTFWPVWLWGNQKHTPLPPPTKGQLFDPICFCYSVLGTHSFEYKFFKRYLQWVTTLFSPHWAPGAAPVFFFFCRIGPRLLFDSFFCHNTSLSYLSWLTSLKCRANFGRSPTALWCNCVYFFEWNS